MLLGCCHCGQEPSDSIPPSESSQPSASDSQPSADVIQTIDTNCAPNIRRCLNEIVPIRFGISVTKVGTPSAVCHPHYEGAFTLFYVPGECYMFNSAELAKNQSGGSCPDNTSGEPRWRMVIVGGFGAATQIGVSGLFVSSGFLTTIVSYGLVVSPGNINCVNSFTLNRTSQAFNWGFPLTLTVNPV